MKKSELEALRSGTKTIGIVADTEERRQQMVEAIHLLKLPGVRSYRNFFELSVDIDKQAVQWVYATFYDQEGEPLGAYLPQMTSHPTDLVAVVVAIKGEEKGSLPSLFNSGLLQWLDVESAPDAMAQNLFKFLKQLDANAELPLQAFYSLRNFLKSEKRWLEISTTAERLIQLYPHEDMLRLNHIEALANQGEQGRARSLLLDLDLYDSKLAPYIAQLRESLLQQNDSYHKLLAVQYHMHRALIVDPLPESLSLIESKCRELGFRDVHVFKDGAEAGEFLKKETIDFAVIEWQSPSLSGPFLIQRIREKKPADIPIIVISDKLDRSDIQLVKDMGVAQVLKRPLNAQQLAIAAAWAISQAKAPTEAFSIERKIMSSLAEGKLSQAEQLLQKFRGIASRDPLKDLYLKACLAYHRGQFQEAKTLLLEATHRSHGDNVNLAAMLAKCLIRLGDSKAALLLLKRVTSFSPKNLERLCSLASVALENNDLQLAEESLYAAETLDAKANQVQETKVKVAVAGGLNQVAGDTIKLIADVEGVIAYLNNLAVTLAKSLDFSEAARLYKNCLKIIPAEKSGLRAIVAYNLGLGMIKNKETQLGSIYIKQAIDSGPSPVLARAESLHQRILEARKHGVDPELRLVRPPPFAEEETMNQQHIYQDVQNLRERSRLLKGMVLPTSTNKRAS